jgi:hypothetical protein
MSELSAAAAAALGVPESIVLRSAAARATETGMTVDEVLGAWAGGEAAPAATSAAPTATEETSPRTESAAEAPDAPPSADDDAPLPAGDTNVPSPPVEPRAAPAPAAVSGRPPVLVGKSDNPFAVLVGVVALFVGVVLVGLIGPSLPADIPGARSSELALTESAEHGRETFQSIGCAACHTQLVRPVVTDVGLGAVSLSDSNQVLGTRRFGPDLSDAGSRLTGSQIDAIVTGLGGHPVFNLSEDDMNDLVAYLLESKTSVEASQEPVATEEEGAEPVEGEDGS